MQRKSFIALTLAAALASWPLSAAERLATHVLTEEPGNFVSDMAAGIRDVALAALQLVLPIHAEGDPWGLHDEDPPSPTAESGDVPLPERSAIHAEGDPWG